MLARPATSRAPLPSSPPWTNKPGTTRRQYQLLSEEAGLMTIAPVKANIFAGENSSGISRRRVQ